ncbi:YbaN family protein [Neptunicella marina]|uniref:Inner membrane protein n=1 Tax=Neptunicella marina TaxID=2125989 RepID=A0A8J6J0J9_9ALTE|nr:YbaN family protein [Neptunicella marina]MBC3767711.1 YbaN family protein [Neptunicella marina]
MKFVVIWFWRGIAIIALILGFIGIPLPGLPTVPFLLLSAWAASKGWPRLESFLINHPKYGSTIRQWREQGAIPLKAKYLSSGMMSVSAVIFALTDHETYKKVLLVLLMLIVAIWIWRRPLPK